MKEFSERRVFESEEAWKLKSKAEMLDALDAALRPLDGKLSLDINGNAWADINIDIAEYVMCKGDPRYFYQSINLGGSYEPDDLKGEVTP